MIRTFLSPNFVLIPVPFVAEPETNNYSRETRSALSYLVHTRPLLSTQCLCLNIVWVYRLSTPLLY